MRFDWFNLSEEIKIIIESIILNLRFCVLELLGIRANTLACQKPCVVRLALTLLSVCYPLFSVPPAAGQSQIEPTRALANRRKPRGSGISHGSRFARPSGRTWSNLRPLECVNISARKLDFDGVCKLKN